MYSITDNEVLLQRVFRQWFVRVNAWGTWIDFYHEIADAYQGPIRHYHTFFGHIDSCIRELLDIPIDLIEDIDAVILALLLHDIETDEEQSVRVAMNFCDRMGIPETFVRRVSDHIRATDPQAVPVNSDSRLAADIDRAIFGKDVLTFDLYEQNIRKEYPLATEQAFRKKRIEVLQSFLDRPSIFLTEYFRAQYEEQARANLIRSIEQLKR